MLRLAFLVTGVLLLGFAAEPLFHAARNRQQVTISCDAFAQSRPTALWLRITGCEMDYLGAGYRQWGGRIVEMYFPARPQGQSPTDPAPIVAATSDPSVLALAEDTIGAGRTPSQEQFLVMMLRIVTILRASREIEGYARGSLLQRLASKSALAGLSAPLASNALVVDLHATPRPVLPAAAAAAGIVLLGTFVILRSKRRARTGSVGTPTVPPQSAQQDPSIDAAVEGLPTAGSDAPAARIRVMLLNLSPDAGVDAIERAPPIGSGTDVVARLCQAVSGLHFEASGRASVSGTRYELTVDIGPTDPVYTVVLDAYGPAAATIVRRIVDSTGWRAFDAKSGVFVQEKGEG